MTERTLELKHELGTAGAVYSLEAFNGKLLAGVNNKLQLYEWMPCARAPRLQLRHEHCGHILVLYLQARVRVGVRVLGLGLGLGLGLRLG